MAADRVAIYPDWSNEVTPTLYLAAPAWAGVWHRFRTLNQARIYLRHAGIRGCFLWGVSDGVAHCGYAELLSPLPGIDVIDVPEAELADIEKQYRRGNQVLFRGQTLHAYRAGVPRTHTLVFDLWGDFAATAALMTCVPIRSQIAAPLLAAPCSVLRKEADARIRQWDMGKRVGIRARITENPADGRTLARVQRQLDAAVKTIVRLPWYVRVFVVTDSAYVQQMLGSHFRDICFIPKRFALREAGGYYVDRDDRDAMKAFIVEVACLGVCLKIVNLGGFLNEELHRHKTIDPSCEPRLLLSAVTPLDRVRRYA